MSAEKYIAEIKKLIERVERTQMENIQRAAELVADAISRDRLIYVFGAGHSHLLANEVFARAGGLISMQAMLDPGLGFMAGAERQGGFERLPGYARIVIQDYDIRANDVIIVISNSGRNPAPVQMALEAKQRGATVIALTSLPHSTNVSSADPSGKRLFEIADLALDNGCPPGDALVRLEGLPPPVGPSTGVIGALILHAIVVQAAQNLLNRGIMPLVAFSGNLEGAQEYNDQILRIGREKFRDQMRHM